MEKDITIVYNHGSSLNFTTEEWKSKNNIGNKLIDIKAMHDLIQWLEDRNTSTIRIECKNSSDLILFRNSIKYVTINE